MKKRLLSVFMCLSMILMMAPAAFASDSQNTPDAPVTQTEEQDTPAPDTEQSPENGGENGESTSAAGDMQENKTESTPADSLLEDSELPPSENEEITDTGEAPAQEGADSLPAADENGVITLTADTSISSESWTLNDSVTIDLNNHTLTITGAKSIIVPEGKTLTFKNGSVTANGYAYNKTVLSPSKNASLILEGIKMETTGSAILPSGDNAVVSVTDSEIHAKGTYTISTNATKESGSYPYGANYQITLKNSVLKADDDSNHDTCGVMINVPLTLSMDNCTVIGGRQGMMVRAGTANIQNSTIQTTGEFYNDTNKDVNQYHSSNWGSGNEVPAAAITVGNYVNGEAATYEANAEVTLTNTTVQGTESLPAIYVDANTKFKSDVSISGENTSVTGEIKTGQQTKEGQINISITGGTYTTDVSNHLGLGYACTENSGKYVVGVADGAQVETDTDEEGNVSATVDGSYSGNESSESGENGSISTDESGKVTIDVASSGSESASPTKVEVTVGANALTSIDKADSVKEVELKTSVGTLTISDAAWSDMTAKANESGNGAGLVLTLENKSTENGNPVYEVTATINEANAFDGSGSGAVTLSVPFAAESADTAKVFCIDGGKLEDMNATVSGEGSKTLTWSTTHFSSFGVVPYSTSNEPEVFYIQSGESSTQAQGGQFSAAASAVSTDGGAITLNKDVMGSLTVAQGKTVTLDLNGHKLTNDGDAQAKSHTITNNGTLTIEDSSAGKTGTVDNVSHQKAALVNNGIATLNGGTFTRSKEGGEGAEESGGNSYYTLDNSGTMTINDGVMVKNTGAFSSMIHNGYYNGTGETNTPELTINGGIFDGGLNTVKNDDRGKLEIKGGTFENTAQAVVLNWNDTTISGGTFTPKEGAGSVILNGRTSDDEGMDKGHLTITGGTFNGSDTVPVIKAMGTGDASKDNSGIIEISGGTLTGDIQLAYTANASEAGLGSSLKISGNAVIDGDVINGGVTGVTVEGGTVKGDIANQSSGKIEISGGTVEGAVTNIGEGGTITVTGGTFTTADVSDFVDSNSAITITFDANGGTCGVKTMILTKDNGSATISSLPTPTRSGSYTFNGWYTSASGGSKVTTTTAFSTNTTLYAHWNYTGGSSGGGGGSSSASYAITIDKTSGGTVKVSPTRADKGDTVTITVDPKNGYELDKLVVTDKNGDTVKLTDKGNGKYTFKMPGSKVEIEASFVSQADPDIGLPFVDVPSGSWYEDAARYVYEKGLMAGTSDTTFSPNTTTTRGMIVTILYRLEGAPAVSGSSSFTDVAAGRYYADAVAWAAANNIVGGYGNGLFGPNDTITREQMAAILYRYAQYKGYDVTASADLSGYSDAAQVSSYALAALQWANAEGLVNGTSGTTLTPGGSATRAQVAVILMRFCENIVV